MMLVQSRSGSRSDGATIAKAHPDLRAEELGDASVGKALDDRLAADFRAAEFLSVPITLVILIVAFGALLAAGIPVLLGLTAVFSAIADLEQRALAGTITAPSSTELAADGTVALAGTTVAVGTMTAETVDDSANLSAHAPLVFGAVLTMAFLLLLVTFRSIVIPIKAIVLNLGHDQRGRRRAGRASRSGRAVVDSRARR